ncbi:MAG: serine hydrolase [Haliscomenobacter sp.]|nr:serine hydrolase [Haliscomenobacter sp.]
MRSFFLLICALGLSISPGGAQNFYFPPLTGSTWETVSPASLGWCTDQIDSLYRFLDQKNTKAFIVLKDGKIVLEKYFDQFTRDSIWYWASAGKTLTAFLVGQAQEEGLLKVSDSTSKYLGKGWTSLPAGKEDNITIWNELTMTSGLDDKVADPYCTVPTCLIYKADAGTRWAYHNAPYTLLENVLESASKKDINVFTASRLRDRIGMNGAWFKDGYNNVYFSNARSMARFGLLILNKGVWNRDTLLRDAAYFRQMATPSQSINNSYGYLWWLNGYKNHMLPGTQIVFNGSIVPNAPKDMIAGLGKNDQKVYVVPSSNLVVVRMGESAGLSLLALSNFDDQLWDNLNSVLCKSTPVRQVDLPSPLNVYPNPVSGVLHLDLPGQAEAIEVRIFDMQGKLVRQLSGARAIPVAGLSRGLYAIRARTEDALYIARFVKE